MDLKLHSSRMNVRHYDKMFDTTRSRAAAHTRLENGAMSPMNFPTINPSGSSYRRKSLNAYQRTPAVPATSTTSLLPSSSHCSKSGSSRIAVTSSGSSPSTGNSSVVLAITAGRGEARAEVGMAAIDPRTPHLVLCQMSDCQTYASALAKIYVFDPVQVLMPVTMCDRNSGKNELYRLIREKFPGLAVTSISRVHFSESAGIERVRSLCASDYSSVELFLKEKYYALAAAAALLKYVEYIQRVPYVPKSMKIEFQGPQHATTIDMESSRNLELVASQSGQKNASLLATLDRCSTPMGRKLLRANILQPPCEERVILGRQTCVSELASNRSLRALIQPVIRRLYGADKLLSLPTQLPRSNSVQSAEKNLNYILLLKNSLDAVPELRTVLANAKTVFFRRVCQNLDDERFRLMRDNILRVIHPNARCLVGYTSSNMQRCFAVKPKINDLLDVARQTYCELIDDMKNLVERLASKHKLALSLGSNATMGYHVRAIFPRKANVKPFDLPTEFIQVRINKNSFTMTTKTLMVLSQQCKTASEEVELMSNLLLCDLLKSTREHVGCLFRLSADLAELDLIVSLAETSSATEYARPTFGPRLMLEDSTHPVMESLGLDRPVANDVRATIPFNFHFITGPNMSGKSTYLKQIVLLQIMAQIGCYVPARRAEFRIADHIFCKIGFRDEIDCNASTFVVEMKEVQYILDTVTPSSLVILDELCRCTTVEEGASLAWAICERLLITSAFTFIATHFFHLTKLADVYYNVTNHRFETSGSTVGTESNEHRSTYTYRLKRGSAPADDYGIALAELSLPKSVTELARKYARELYDESTMIIRRSEAEGNAMISWEQTCYNFVAEAYDLMDVDRFDHDNVRGMIERFNATSSSGVGVRGSAMFAKKSNAVDYEADATEAVGLACQRETFAQNCGAFAVPEWSSLISFEERRVRSTDGGSCSDDSIGKLVRVKRSSITDIDGPASSVDYPPRAKSSGSSPRSTLSIDRDDPVLTNSTISSADFTPLTPKLHEYCLSDDDYLPSGSRVGSNLENLDLGGSSAFAKEARIFRQIEGPAFDEAKFYDSAQVDVDLTDDRTSVASVNLGGSP